VSTVDAVLHCASASQVAIRTVRWSWTFPPVTPCWICGAGSRPRAPSRLAGQFASACR